MADNERVRRSWRLEGLRVLYRKRKHALRGIGVAVGATCSIGPNMIWDLDFQFDQTTDGKNLKLLNVFDEYTSESWLSTPMGWCPASRNWALSAVLRLWSALTMGRSPSPALWPTGALQRHRPCPHRPRSPRQNAGIESLNDDLTDEYLNGQLFETIAELRALLNDRAFQHTRLAHPDRVRRSLAQITTPHNRIRVAQQSGPLRGSISSLLSDSEHKLSW